MHILGIADPRSVETGARHGADTFDSCFATRVARHGTLLTRDGPVHIGQGKYRGQNGPIDPSLGWDHTDPLWCSMSRAYLHHLRRMHEPLYETLASMHNLRFMTHTMAEIRERIRSDDL